MPSDDADGTPRVVRRVVYPVKGGAGQTCQAVDVQERGLEWDRRWMVVGEDRTFRSQRQLPALATIRAEVTQGELRLSARYPGAGSVTLAVTPPPSAPRVAVSIWRDVVEAVCLPEAGRWASPLLGRPCDLVFMPEEVRRPVNPAFARTGEVVSFADGYPVMLVGKVSLSDLNARLGMSEAMGLERFRPNVVVSTTEPFAEDGWRDLFPRCRFASKPRQRGYANSIRYSPNP